MKLSFLNQKGGAGRRRLRCTQPPCSQPPVRRCCCLMRTRKVARSTGRRLGRGLQRSRWLGFPNRPCIRNYRVLSEDFDHVVIDGPPRVAEVTRSVIMASDLVAIPVQPSPYDVWAVKDVVELIKEARYIKIY